VVVAAVEVEASFAPAAPANEMAMARLSAVMFLFMVLSFRVKGRSLAGATIIKNEYRKFNMASRMRRIENELAPKRCARKQ
jgi:hypothetical protein